MLTSRQKYNRCILRLEYCRIASLPVRGSNGEEMVASERTPEQEHGLYYHPSSPIKARASLSYKAGAREKDYLEYTETV